MLSQIGQYTVTINPPYVYIHVLGKKDHYQLKLDDEGLVLDIIGEREGMESLFHCMNDEVLDAGEDT